jgi:hypothetical protein
VLVLTVLALTDGLISEIGVGIGILRVLALVLKYWYLEDFFFFPNALYPN